MAEQPTLHRGNVAVVIPALNESLRIREVVEGALAQSDLVIVVDDGSDDETAAIVARTPAVRHSVIQMVTAMYSSIVTSVTTA